MTTPATTVSVSSYLHLVPTTLKDYTAEEIKSLVLDYLYSSCYPDSAKAFALEVQKRKEYDESTKTQGMMSESNGNENGSSGKSNGKGKESSRLSTTIGQNETSTLNGHDGTNTNRMEGIESAPDISSFTRLRGGGDDIEMDDAMGDAREGGEEDDELEEDLEVESTLRSNGGTNAQAVAFYDETLEEEEEGWPGLSKEDLRLLRLRRDIRDDIINGRIQRAVDLLSEHFPSVLSSPSSPPSTSEPCTPHSFFVSTSKSASPDSSSSTSSLIFSPANRNQVPTLGSTFTPSALSLSPTICSLNLQLQSFVELIRTANATTTAPSTPPTTQSASPRDSPPPSINNNNNQSSNGNGNNMSSSMSSLLSTRTHSMLKAIAHSQALGAKVKQMPSGKMKDEWERECVDVSGLMAYTDLSVCPVRGYLAQERREVLAELINAAVLKSLNKTPMSVLALATRQTTTIWSALAEWKVAFPPSSSGTSKTKVKTVGRFDLKTFLTEGDSSTST